eukprot:scaffold228111_cov34-Tisochrysis_lutea.AAC.3
MRFGPAPASPVAGKGGCSLPFVHFPPPLGLPVWHLLPACRTLRCPLPASRTGSGRVRSGQAGQSSCKSKKEPLILKGFWAVACGA